MPFHFFHVSGGEVDSLSNGFQKYAMRLSATKTDS